MTDQTPLDRFKQALTGTARALARGGAGDEDLLEGREAPVGVVAVLLDARAVEDVDDVVDRDGRLGDVGRDDHLPHPARRPVKDAQLIRRGERRVQREHAQPVREGAV